MRFRPLAAAALCVLLGSCSQQRGTVLLGVEDLPLKSVTLPGMDWQMSPLRANAQYLLYSANTEAERVKRLGDYYYVRWYDAQPEKPVKLLMSYTQALTASRILTREVALDEPRAKAGYRKTEFFFSGPERARRGDILSWKVELYVDGKLCDSRQSYLWK